ncbi:uncharacterized protein BO95DRAFT_468006 [Aspergillus brunneoviolaceus CBS 621.78]|uniref:Uncharacterized protein n=1 Tax=Aspergillus brunneoviolaceus CBS 621.78 TaxID=1450534 RepID=A0ACD1FW63_9EURO|nr:hypothetical protein BO95DRAFT_468006 [Aspergillus brunneoviolaceus CBS 621.78]RAH41263.1 hypothetical protein BO95DRAFT_468006 [Aspergillus brunneoviolaceus CBS 621.78]
MIKGRTQGRSYSYSRLGLPPGDTSQGFSWRKWCRFPSRLPFLTLLNLTLIIGNAIFYVNSRTWTAAMKNYCPDLPESPLKTGIYYEPSVMDIYAYNPYGGDPRPELEESWDNLMRKSFFRATKDEMIQWGEYGDDSIALENGGYLAYLRVYGELHCMDWLKRQYSREDVRIAKNITEKDRDHCVNVLLQGVRCRADVALSGWFLGADNEHKPLINRTAANHLCVNWNSVESWLAPRALEFRDGVPEKSVTPEGHVEHHAMLQRSRYH